MLCPRLTDNSLSFNKASSESANEVLFFAILLCGKYVVTLGCKPYHKVMPRWSQTLEERFWSKVQKTATCWLWTELKNKKGYGLIRIQGKNKMAHRISYELVNAPLNENIVRHTCDTPACVNPAHLLPGTHAQNVADMDSRGRRRNHNQSKTHCIHGHEFTLENTKYNKGKRSCRKCRRVLDLKYRAKRNA